MLAHEFNTVRQTAKASQNLAHGRNVFYARIPSGSCSRTSVLPVMLAEQFKFTCLANRMAVDGNGVTIYECARRFKVGHKFATTGARDLFGVFAPGVVDSDIVRCLVGEQL